MKKAKVKESTEEQREQIKYSDMDEKVLKTHYANISKKTLRGLCAAEIIFPLGNLFLSYLVTQFQGNQPIFIRTIVNFNFILSIGVWISSFFLGRKKTLASTGCLHMGALFFPIGVNIILLFYGSVIQKNFLGGGYNPNYFLWISILSCFIYCAIFDVIVILLATPEFLYIHMERRYNKRVKSLTNDFEKTIKKTVNVDYEEIGAGIGILAVILMWGVLDFILACAYKDPSLIADDFDGVKIGAQALALGSIFPVWVIRSAHFKKVYPELKKRREEILQKHIKTRKSAN